MGKVCPTLRTRHQIDLVLQEYLTEVIYETGIAFSSSDSSSELDSPEELVCVDAVGEFFMLLSSRSFFAAEVFGGLPVPL